MTQAAKSEKSQPLDEAQVVEYLRHHADFFSRHAELLTDLNLPHETGAAISLIERQVSLLREQRDALSRKMESLIQLARDNELLSDDLHAFTLALLDSESMEEIFSITENYLRMEFDADAVAIRLLFSSDMEEEEERLDYVMEQGRMPTFERILMAGEPSCHPLSQEEAFYLFGDEAADIASSAVIPLVTRDETVYGLIAIGSSDPERFEADMDTLFLRRLGEFIAHLLQGHLRQEP